jgi:hypothetical protein
VVLEKKSVKVRISPQVSTTSDQYLLTNQLLRIIVQRDLIY